MPLSKQAHHKQGITKPFTLSYIFTQSKRDFFSPTMMMINLVPIACVLLVCGVLFFVFAGSFIEYMIGLLPQSWRVYVESSELGSGFVRFVIRACLYAMLFFCMLLFTCMTNIFASVFYTPFVVSYIRKHHYPYLHAPHSMPLRYALGYICLCLVWLVLACVVCVPLLFVPFVGWVVYALIFFVFFYKSMLFDISGEVLGRQILQKARYKHILAQDTSTRRYVLFACVYGLGFVPILHIFMPLLQVICISHYCFGLAHRLESSQNSSRVDSSEADSSRVDSNAIDSSKVDSNALESHTSTHIPLESTSRPATSHTKDTSC